MAKYRVTWWDEVQRELIVEAKDKEEAKKKFFEGSLDLSEASVEDENYIEGSLEIDKE